MRDVALRLGAIAGLARLKALGAAADPGVEPGRLCQGQDDARLPVGRAPARGRAAGRTRSRVRRLPLFVHPSRRQRAACQRPVVRAQAETVFLAGGLDFDLEHSWMIGNRDSDIACGRAAGTRTILVRNPHARGQSGAGTDAAAGDLQEAAGSWTVGRSGRGARRRNRRGRLFWFRLVHRSSVCLPRPCNVMERHIGG